MGTSNIKVTTADLRSQSARIDTVTDELKTASDLCGSSIDILGYACSLFMNMGVLISARSLKKKLDSLAADMDKASKLALGAACAYENADKEIMRQMDGLIGDVEVSDTVNDYSDIQAPEPLNDLKAYSDTVIDAEYARLSGWWEHVCDKKDPVGEFMKELQKLPENDPMRYITREQITHYDGSDGFSAIVIDDGNGSALVIFAGTNPDQMGDIITDIAVGVGLPSSQENQACKLVHDLAEDYDNIIVTGHSLGGYLATKAALSEGTVSECIAFEAPGQYNAWYHNDFNSGNSCKIRTYNANGSYISSVGDNVGKVYYVDVEPSGSGFTANHSIDKLGDALGGDDAIANCWAGEGRAASSNENITYTQTHYSDDVYNGGGGGSW